MPYLWETLEAKKSIFVFISSTPLVSRVPGGAQYIVIEFNWKERRSVD